MMHFCSIYNMSGCTKLLAHQTWFSPGLAFAIAEIGNQSICLNSLNMTGTFLVQLFCLTRLIAAS